MGFGVTSPFCGAAKRRFTVADDIGLVQFVHPWTDAADPYVFSPDRRYFTVLTERGLLDRNRPESSLRVFLSEDVRQFLLHPEIQQEPSPIWVVSKSTHKDGPIISDIRWLADSTGIAFLAKTPSGNHQLFLANIKRRTLEPLTPADQDVKTFDIHNRNYGIYSAQYHVHKESRTRAVVGTGQSFYSMIFPESVTELDSAHLWTIVNGKRFQVQDKATGKPINLHCGGRGILALSPDNRSVITALPVSDVPLEWESLYLSPRPDSPYRIRAGRQDLEKLGRSGYCVAEFVTIDLSNGRIKPLIEAPIGDSAGWWAIPTAAWSADGRAVVLSNTFLPPNKQDSGGSRKPPCVAVVDLRKGSYTCLENVKIGEGEWHLILAAYFDHGTRNRLVVEYDVLSGFTSTGRSSTTYLRSDNGSWAAIPVKEKISDRELMKVSVRQTLNDPPALVATDETTGASRIIWKPNLEVESIDLGEASVFNWQDKRGRMWIGGLYKPPDYDQRQRYPLVIQTHGFNPNAFLPSGLMPTAFAARELAAAGILVLQVQDGKDQTSFEEGASNVEGYEAGIQQLANSGVVVDPDRIGIVGFSRSCFYVMEALTTSSLHFKAASITDGINLGYLQYIMSVDASGSALAHEYDAMVGARPFGEGLQLWLKRSPIFNMQNVTAPLQVAALGRGSLLGMWEPYAALRYLNKPVDLINLGEGTHVLTNPVQRMASQGGTLDWFRFWLKEEEDTDVAKAEQYARWHDLRKLQEQKEATSEESVEVPIR